MKLSRINKFYVISIIGLSIPQIAYTDLDKRMARLEKRKEAKERERFLESGRYCQGWAKKMSGWTRLYSGCSTGFGTCSVTMESNDAQQTSLGGGGNPYSYPNVPEVPAMDFMRFTPLEHLGEPIVDGETTALSHKYDEAIKAAYKKYDIYKQDPKSKEKQKNLLTSMKIAQDIFRDYGLEKKGCFPEYEAQLMQDFQHLQMQFNAVKMDNFTLQSKLQLCEMNNGPGEGERITIPNGPGFFTGLGGKANNRIPYRPGYYQPPGNRSGGNSINLKGY